MKNLQIFLKANQKAPNFSKNSIFSTKFSLFTTNFFRDSNYSTGAEQDNWQDILEKTQNAIYCKEIYNQVIYFNPFYRVIKFLFKFYHSVIKRNI
jgi:hypothetical protein